MGWTRKHVNNVSLQGGTKFDFLYIKQNYTAKQRKRKTKEKGKKRDFCS